MSKRSKDELSVMESVAGVMSAVVTVLVSAVRKLGGTFEHIRRLTTPEGAGTVEQIAALIVGEPQGAVSPNWWKDFLAALIQSCGFSWANSEINGDNFLCEANFSSKVEIVSIKDRLVALGRDWLSTDEVLAYLDELGFRPATLLELLFWHLQNQASTLIVVALGSVWTDRNGGVDSPYLYYWYGGRVLDLYRRGAGGNDDCVFAAVRK